MDIHVDTSNPLKQSVTVTLGEDAPKKKKTSSPIQDAMEKIQPRSQPSQSVGVAG